MPVGDANHIAVRYIEEFDISAMADFLNENMPAANIITAWTAGFTENLELIIASEIKTGG